MKKVPHRIHQFFMRGEFWKQRVKQDLPIRKINNLFRNTCRPFSLYYTFRFEHVSYSYKIE